MFEKSTTYDIERARIKTVMLFKTLLKQEKIELKEIVGDKVFQIWFEEGFMGGVEGMIELNAYVSPPSLRLRLTIKEPR